MIRSKMLWLAPFALVLASCGGGNQPQQTAEQPSNAPATPAAAPVDAASAATITGKVSFEGSKPTPIRIKMDAVPACTQANKGAPVYVEDVVVNDNGTLRNVYVYVKDGLGDKTFPVSSDPVVLEQKGCQYHPHVIALMAGQKLEVRNEDPTNHNIHPMPKDNREWNQSQPPGAPPIEQDFARPEVMIPVKCNVHPWMKAYIGVQKNPFFSVTGDDGTFTIKGLPPGDYTIEAWQEKYGTSDQKVTVGPKETKSVDFSFKG